MVTGRLGKLQIVARPSQLTGHVCAMVVDIPAALGVPIEVLPVNLDKAGVEDNIKVPVEAVDSRIHDRNCYWAHGLHGVIAAAGVGVGGYCLSRAHVQQTSCRHRVESSMPSSNASGCY